LALQHNTTGFENTAVGYEALAQNTTGSHNTALGAFAGGGVTTAESVICIGVEGADVSSSCYVGNIWNQPGGLQAVYVNSQGKLGAQVSSRRFKDEIRPIEQISEIIYGLKPVSFRYKPEIEPTRPLGFGLIAEEVEKISSDLVTRDSNGQANAVRYDAVNAMLLNEFLKEHRKVEELKSAMAQQRKEFEAAMAQQRKAIEAVLTRLNEQETRIQKVSAQVEVGNSGSQMLVENQ
jgi:trimeric autotransporter adhesin